MSSSTPIPPPLDSGLQSFVRQAQQDLAKRLSVPVDQIELVEVRDVIWPDKGLGCPQPGMAYAPGAGRTACSSGSVRVAACTNITAAAVVLPFCVRKPRARTQPERRTRQSGPPLCVLSSDRDRVSARASPPVGA